MESIKIRPRGKYVLVRMVKREATPSGLVIPGTARGYDVIEVVARGPAASEDLAPGAIVMLYPGNRTMITFDESPDVALVSDEDVICIDERDPAELLAAQERRIVIAAGESIQ